MKVVRFALKSGENGPRTLVQAVLLELSRHKLFTNTIRWDYLFIDVPSKSYLQIECEWMFFEIVADSTVVVEIIAGSGLGINAQLGRDIVLQSDGRHCR